MAWLKEALSKATKAGFEVPDDDAPEAASFNSRSSPLNEADEGKYAELVLRFKQFKSQVQVSAISIV